MFKGVSRMASGAEPFCDVFSSGKRMQRFINDPDNLVDETVAGFVRAHSDLVRLDPENDRVVVSTTAPRPGRVGIVTGGGSGHEPAFIGYTGRNLVDATAVAGLFS